MSLRWPGEPIRRTGLPSVASGVDFGAQAATGATKALGIRPLFPTGAGCLLMRPHDG